MTPLAAPQFEAIIVPHRSLGRRGRWVLAGAILGLSGIITSGLLLAGAWPVIGFNGVEIGLALFLLRRHARGDQANEVLLLSDAGLRITRIDTAGRRTGRTIPATWLQVVLQERPGRTPALLLVNRGVQVEVATALGEAEKRDLADALSAALHRWRHPRFDNPQLRDEGA